MLKLSLVLILLLNNNSTKLTTAENACLYLTWTTNDLGYAVLYCQRN